MNKYLQFISVLSLVISLTGCETYSKYTIDEKPVIKTDPSLMGIWKEIDNSGRGDYIIVQSFQDVFGAEMKMRSDLDVFNAEHYRAVDGKDYDYYITNIDNRKQKPEYGQLTCFMSKVGDACFLNSDNRYVPYTGGRGFEREDKAPAYFFAKISVNDSHDVITVSNVADTTLKFLTNSKQVRNRLAININRAAFYSDTTRFYKINNYHASLNAAIIMANKRK